MPAMMPMKKAAQPADMNAQGAVMATSPPSIPLHIMDGSGLPYIFHMIEAGGDGGRAGGEHGVDGDEADAIGRAGKARAGVEAEPAEGEDERAEHHHRHVMPKMGRGFPSSSYFPMRGPIMRHVMKASVPP